MRQGLRTKLVYGMMGLLLVAGLMVAACRPAATPTPAPTPTPPPVAATPTPVPKPTGELRLAFPTLQREMLDPIKTSNIDKYVLAHLYDWILEGDEEGKLVAGVAYKWDISPDYKVYTLYIRKGVKFHNGDEVTPDDVKFTLERAIGPGSVASMKGLMVKVMDVVTVEAPDKVSVRLKSPEPSFIYYLAPLVGTEGAVVPKRYIEEKGEDYFAEHPVGTGAYRFMERVFGSYMKFEAMDSHWRWGVPKYKYITVMKVPEESTRLAMLKTGEADIVSISKAGAEEAKKAGFGIARKVGATDVHYFIIRMFEPDNPMKDHRVRQALSLAINREEIVKGIFYGNGKPKEDFYGGSWNMGWVPMAPTPYNPALAKQLLAEAGYPGGKGLKSITIYAITSAALPETKTVAEAIAGYWGEVGVKADIIVTDYPTVRGKWIDGTKPYPSIASEATGNRLGQLPNLYNMTGSGTIFKALRTQDAKVEALTDEAMTAPNPEEQNRKYAEIEKYCIDNTLVLGIAEIDDMYAVDSKKVGEWKMGRNAYDINLKYLFKQQ